MPIPAPLVKFGPQILSMLGKALKALVPVLVLALAYHVGSVKGGLEAKAEYLQESARVNAAIQKSIEEEREKRHREAMEDLAKTVAEQINAINVSEVRRETIRTIITPDKDEYCRPDDRIVRLLERSRSGDYSPLRAASEPSTQDRATPESFSYADFIESYEELTLKYHTLRSRSNKLTQWNLDHAQPTDHPKGVRESLE